VVRNNRLFVIVGGVVVAACLSACGGAGASGPSGDGGSGAVTGPPGPAAGGTASQRPTDSATTGSSSVSFALAEGAQRDICGIHLRVVFIPPSANQTAGYQAFLVGAPISGVPAANSDPTPGDQPLPGNASPATPGQTATVLGKKFRVSTVDVAGRRVELVALC
jgi:hypothetical protein